MITKDDILKEEGGFEVCDYAQGVIETLYPIYSPGEEYIKNLPEVYRVIYVISEMWHKDSFDGYLDDLVARGGVSMEDVEQIVMALNNIGESKLAQLVLDVYQEYLDTGTYKWEQHALLKDLDHRMILELSLSKYIKKHVDDIITDEYKKKMELFYKNKSEPDDRSDEDYKNSLNQDFPWFKM